MRVGTFGTMDPATGPRRRYVRCFTKFDVNDGLGARHAGQDAAAQNCIRSYLDRLVVDAFAWGWINREVSTHAGGGGNHMTVVPERSERRRPGARSRHVPNGSHLPFVPAQVLT